MLNVALWTFALYAVLKLCHLVMGSKRVPDGAPIPATARLRAGEPALLAGTLTVTAMLLLFTGWWSHKFHAGHYAYAAACYPALAAAPALPAARPRFGSYEASEAVRHLHLFAREHGAALGLDEAAIERRLEITRLASVTRYRLLAASGDRPALTSTLAQLNHCLRGEGSPRGEILNP